MVLVACLSMMGCRPSNRDVALDAAWEGHADDFESCKKLFSEFSSDENRVLTESEVSNMMQWQLEGGLISDTATTALIAYSTRDDQLELKLKNQVPVLLRSDDPMVKHQGVKIATRFKLNRYDPQFASMLTELKAKESLNQEETLLFESLNLALGDQ